MSTFVVAHGAWSSGWAWKKMRPLMFATGHEMFTPSYTGLGDRAHLANSSIDLDTHIQDVLATLEFEDLRDVVLLGHSYGGMVATAVADRARARIAQRCTYGCPGSVLPPVTGRPVAVGARRRTLTGTRVQRFIAASSSPRDP